MWAVRLARLLRAPARRLPPGITVSVRSLPSSSGASVRVLGAPSGGEPRPALLWIHGGGYMIGNAQQDDLLCARFAERLGVTVVSVDYRLAPEHPFPAPEDRKSVV